MTIKTVTLVGAGAVGAVIASSLNKFLGKNNLQILAEGERLERYRKNGLYLDGQKLDFNYVSPEEAAETDLVIIATKNLQLSQTIKMIKNAVGPSTTILSLLNGIQSELDIGDVYGPEKVLYSFVLSLNSIHEDNQIRCSNPGTMIFGEKDNSKTERTEAILELCKNAGIRAVNPEDIHLEQWKKYLINVTFNTLSALCRSTYGGFNYPVMQDLARQTGKEVIAIANAEGVPLTIQNLEDDIKMMCGHDPLGETSMLQDMKAERNSENDWFCGTIIRLGKKHSIPVPVCTLLQQLVEGTEKVREIRNK